MIYDPELQMQSGDAARYFCEKNRMRNQFPLKLCLKVSFFPKVRGFAAGKFETPVKCMKS